MFLAVVLFLGLATVACASLRQNAAAESSHLSQPPEDYLWMDYYRLRQGQSWMRIDRSGHVLYVQQGAPGTKQIHSVRGGTLSTSRTEQIFDQLRRIQFFGLEDAVPSGVVEADVLNVGARLEGQHHQVSARPPSAVPPGLMGLVDSLEAVVPELDPVTGDRVLLRAQTVSPERAQELRNADAPQFSADALSAIEAVQSAVHRPDQFILLGPNETAQLRENVKAAPYFLVSSEGQDVAIDLYSLAGSK